MEENKEELFEERLKYAEADIKAQQKVIANLLEYLCRVDENFKSTPALFDDWQNRLEKLRQEDRVQAEIQHAKHCLADHGYLVVKDHSELDAARVKKWVQTKSDRNT